MYGTYLIRKSHAHEAVDEGPRRGRVFHPTSRCHRGLDDAYQDAAADFKGEALSMTASSTSHRPHLSFGPTTSTVRDDGYDDSVV